MKSNLRNEVKSYIVRSGYTMQEVVDRLSEDYGWSDSVSNLSNKLQRESLRYVEAVQLADDAIFNDNHFIRHLGNRFIMGNHDKRLPEIRHAAFQ